VKRLIAEIDTLDSDGMPGSEKVALLYGAIIDDLIWASKHGMEFTADHVDGIIEAYLDILGKQDEQDTKMAAIGDRNNDN
jgi:hypothetical protein